MYKSLIQTKSRKSETPIEIYNQFVLLMSHFIDLESDLRKGDQFYLGYTNKSLQDDSGVTQPGVLEYAELKIKNKTLRLYRYEVNGKENYYDGEGNLVGSFLLKKPLEGGVLSSHYGQRKHPVLGYTRIHKGLDFSAPKGTPVIAAGEGKVIGVERSKSFGI